MRPKNAVLMIVALAALAAATPARGFAADKMKAEELVAKHLEAVGKPEARAAVKTRALQGQAMMTVIVGGSGSIGGTARLDSMGRESLLQIKLDNPQYPGEEFVFDGNKVSVAMFKPGTWSPLAMFIRSQDGMIREGLFGGVLNSGWPLLDVEGRAPKLKYDGLKTVNGHKLHQLSYRGKKGGDLQMKLFFDPETFRHVYSQYTLTRVAGLGSQSEAGYEMPAGPGPTFGASAETNTARQQETRVKLEEWFSDFVTFDGVTLPTTWKFTYTTEGSKTSLIHEYLVKASRIENNAKIESAEFKPSEPPKKQ